MTLRTENYGEDLRLARRHCGIGLSELARAVKCSPAYISMIESGKRFPSPELAERLVLAVGGGGLDLASSMMRTGRLPRRPSYEEAVEIARVLVGARREGLDGL